MLGKSNFRWATPARESTPGIRYAHATPASGGYVCFNFAEDVSNSPGIFLGIFLIPRWRGWREAPGVDTQNPIQKHLSNLQSTFSRYRFHSKLPYRKIA